MPPENTATTTNQKKDIPSLPPNRDPEENDEEEEEEEDEGTHNQDTLIVGGKTTDELKGLLDTFSEEQLRRYEVYRRSGLNRPMVKKLVGAVLNQQVSQAMVFVVAGFAKVFVGELVEWARAVAEEWGDPPDQPLRPDHLREAHRRYKTETGLSPSALYRHARHL